MFKALYESYLSPLYWILRMLGKDTKDKYRDDIDEDLFRLCLKPKTGVEAKKVQKAVRHIYGSVLGSDDKSINDSLSHYYNLRNQVREAYENNEHHSTKWGAQDKLHEFIADVFTEAVTEDERTAILNYLKNNSYMVVVNDEWKNLKEEAEFDAQWKKRVRKLSQFQDEAMANLESDQDDEAA